MRMPFSGTASGALVPNTKVAASDWLSFCGRRMRARTTCPTLSCTSLPCMGRFMSRCNGSVPSADFFSGAGKSSVMPLSMESTASCCVLAAEPGVLTMLKPTVKSLRPPATWFNQSSCL